MKPITTFSIVAYDPENSAWGIAVASKFPAVGAVVPWARAGAGAIATQSYANTSYGPRGLDLMQAGVPAAEALQQLVQDDPERHLRQVGLVDVQGRAATFTGESCFEWAGGLAGDGYCIQGNILAGGQVIDRMAETFEASTAPFPERLLEALLAGDRAGGDRRGRQSAAIFIVKPDGGYGGFNDRWIDYRVDDHEDPVPQLASLLALHRLYFEESPPEDRLPIEGEVCQRLQEILLEQGFSIPKAHGQFDEATRKALREFIGNENFEDRTDFKKGLIDRPVYEYLLEKFGA